MDGISKQRKELYGQVETVLRCTKQEARAVSAGSVLCVRDQRAHRFDAVLQSRAHHSSTHHYGFVVKIPARQGKPSTLTGAYYAYATKGRTDLTQYCEVYAPQICGEDTSKTRSASSFRGERTMRT